MQGNNDKRLFKNNFFSVNSPLLVDTEKKQNFKKYHENLNKPQGIQEATIQGKPTFNYVKIEKKSIISIDSRDRDVNKFPLQNDFISFLGKTFFNVKQIELVSTEIPNTDQTIKETPVELQNNIISWMNEEDSDLNFFKDLVIRQESGFIYITLENHGYAIGSNVNAIIYNSKLDTSPVITGIIDSRRLLVVIDKDTFGYVFENTLVGTGTASLDLGYPIYSVNIKPGNYTAQTLADQIAFDTGLVKRRNGKGQFHFFEVKVNFDTDVLFLDSVTTTQLPSNSISTLAGSNIITVNQKGHGFKSGERVKMIGVKNVAGISSSILNGDFFVNVLDFNTFTYEVVTRASETKSGGGNTIKSGKNAPFRILFDSQNTKIQFNTGFPDEDSSEKMGDLPNGIATTTLKLSNAVIIGENVRFTTTQPHGLIKVSIFDIVNISTGLDPVITTLNPHLIDIPRIVTIRDTNSIPVIKGTYLAVPEGLNKIRISGLKIDTPGNTGQVIYGNDKVKIFDLQTVPSITLDPVYFVENITSATEFDVRFAASDIFLESLSKARIGTSKLTITHPDHGFNQLVFINQYSFGIMLKTLLPLNLKGKRSSGVSIVDGPPGTNTVDVILPFHSLVTSDRITILDSTTDPVVNGTYVIQVIDAGTIRINYVHSSFVNGSGTILTGDYIVISETNSLPKINGRFHVSNTSFITNITTGVFTVDITIADAYVSGWAVNDSITLSDTNCDPPLNGTFTINSIINSNTFRVALADFDITSAGNFGVVVNKSSFIIVTDVSLINPGSFPAGLIGRDNSVSIYRAAPDVPRGDNIGGIPLYAINKSKRKIEGLIDPNTYILKSAEEYSLKTIQGGSGAAISSQKHGLRSIQANTTDGTIDGKLFRSISLEGENYIYLVLDIYGYDCSVVSTQRVSNAFAKIILDQSPGNLCFNSFISEPKIFDSPISKVDNVRLRFVDSRGFTFNFNNINYSLSLKITELIDVQRGSNINSRSGNNQFDGTISGGDVVGGPVNRDRTLKSGNLGASFNTTGQTRSPTGRH